MRVPCLSAPAAASALALVLALSPRLAVAQKFSAAAGNVTIDLTFPAGVTKAKGILAFTERGLTTTPGGGWSGNQAFLDLAKRLESPIAIIHGGNDLDPGGTYPKRCASGEFNNIPDAFKKLATASNHPELANAPLVGLGHSHGGDYWNWFNACHPEIMAMVFVHASGGVNYSAASLKTPVFYALGTSDLIENGSKKPRAGMFSNRSKGAPMTMVIGVGGHDTQFVDSEYQIVTTIIEAIFKLRVPADADAAAGPVKLNLIAEGDSSWVGDLYTKEISTYSTFKGNKALTAYLPSADIATMWKTNGPGLPTSVVLPPNDCSWCGHPTDEPKEIAGGSGAPVTGPASGSADAGSGNDDAGGNPDPGAGSADAATPPTSGADASVEAGSSGSGTGGSSSSGTGGSGGSGSGGSGSGGGTGGKTGTGGSGGSGTTGSTNGGGMGCAVGTGAGGPGAIALLAAMMFAVSTRRRRRR